MLKMKRLNELASWTSDVENPNTQQMIAMLLMGEMRDMAEEIIQLRISLSH